MTASRTAVFWWVGAGALALALGMVTAREPLLLVVAAAVAALALSLCDARRLNYALLAVLFLVPVTADPGYPTSPVWTVLLAATAIALYGRLQRFDAAAPLARPALVAFALPAACLAAGLIRWHGIKPLLVGVFPLACYAIITWHLVEEARRDPAELTRLARTFAWIGVPVALLAVYQRVTRTWPVLDQLATSSAFTSAAGAGRSVGTVGHPIVYGGVCMAAMCVALGLRGRLWQVPFAAGAVGLLLSGSRSAWIGMAVALVVWYLGLPRKLTRRGAYTVLGAAAVAVVLAGLRPRPVRVVYDIVQARLTNVTGSSSATARYQRTAAAMSGIRGSLGSILFGQGPEAHTRFFQQVGIPDALAQTFDNSYLTLWYDFGVLALALFAVLLVLVVWRGTAPTARMLVLAFAAQIWFFDFYLWPAAAATLILAVALAFAVPRGGSA